MHYLIFPLILTILYKYLTNKDKQEESEYQRSRFEIMQYNYERGQDRFIFHELECVNEHAHQKNYNRDILNYKTRSGEKNKGVAKKVYDSQYSPIRKASGEKVTADEPYTALERKFSYYSELEFELELCKLMAAQGYWKDAHIRWMKAKQDKKTVTITEEKDTGSIEWSYTDLTSKNLQASAL